MIPTFQYSRIGFLGDHGGGETPVPIPNTEVKPFSADGTAWVTVWESRTLPRINFVSVKAEFKSPSEMMGSFVCASPFSSLFFNIKFSLTRYPNH
jgi:hypothetical protein